MFNRSSNAGQSWGKCQPATVFLRVRNKSAVQVRLPCTARRKLSRLVSAKSAQSTNGSKLSDESLPSSSSKSADAALTSWYLIGWVVPALASALAGALHWTNRRSPEPLYVGDNHALFFGNE